MIVHRYTIVDPRTVAVIACQCASECAIENMHTGPVLLHIFRIVCSVYCGVVFEEGR